jgi:CRISPR-associated protein Cas5d
MNKALARSKTMLLQVWGDNACFTRPEMKVERVSYDVMTPSAARGVLEAILWKPAIRWQIDQIDVLRPICWESVRRNEVGAQMSSRTSGLYVEDHRQQRAGLFLRNVAYTIHAHFLMTDKAGTEDNIVKFQEMFLRRAEKGQCFHRPYLGCREFSAHFKSVLSNEQVPEPVSETRDLGWMLYDMFHDRQADKDHVHSCTKGCRPSFFKARMENGRINLREIEVRS